MITIPRRFPIIPHKPAGKMSYAEWLTMRLPRTGNPLEEKWDQEDYLTYMHSKDLP